MQNIFGLLYIVAITARVCQGGSMKIGEGDCDWDSDCLPGLDCDSDWWWNDDYCVAGPNTRDGYWGNYGGWSGCSVTCGGWGYKYRYRTCVGPVWGGREPCTPGSIYTNSANCYTSPCPIDCRWGGWSKWGACSKPCGSGMQYRNRIVIEQEANGGKKCSGVAENSRPCNEFECPVDCEWDEWQVGQCSKTCAGGRRKKMRVKKVEEAFGGTCHGQYEDFEDCNTQKCPAIHCEWNDWVIGECDKTCGTGTRTNTRTKSVVEANGGTCSGGQSEIEECNTQPCPVDCEWDDWQIGECSKTCGGGERTNTRSKKVEEAHGGECAGSSTVTESCNIDECPVDCEWDDWQLGECSKTCGAGTRTNTRTKVGEEMYGGTCNGESEAVEDCNTDVCPVDCKWGNWTVGECSKTCGGGIRSNTREKLVVENERGSCYGESSVTEECNIEECPPVIHCVWDHWEIGECSKTCGTGTRTNIRTKLIEEQNGGTCSGDPAEFEACNTMDCPTDCEWDDWQVGDCSKTCGGGTRTNTRSKKLEEANGGVCTGDTSVIESCNEDVYCPVDCEWSAWELGECSKTCGGGTRTNTRTKTVEEMYEGRCDEVSEVEEDCNTEGCPEGLNELCETVGRCGPLFGNGRCNRNLAYWAVYCNSENGWCGDTSAFRDVQPNEDIYDFQSSEVTCGDKHQSCPGWVHAYGNRYCGQSWFTSESGNYGCQKSCGLC